MTAVPADLRVAVIATGTMGEAITGGLLAAEAVRAHQITVSARREERQAELVERYGVTATGDNAAAAAGADVVILCCKPQAAREILEGDLAAALAGKLLISICAGITLAQLATWVPGAALIRAMPNTPVTIREGMTVLAPGRGASRAQVDVARAIFSAVGRCRVLEEKHLDVVTALSGSGPAFACVMVEALADGGVMMGLPREVAVELAAQAVQGAARLVLQTGLHPAALKDEVTTPAGCTIAGLLTMEDGRIRSTLARTIQESTRVASGLGK